MLCSSSVITFIIIVRTCITLRLLYDSRTDGDDEDSPVKKLKDEKAALIELLLCGFNPEEIMMTEL